MPEFSSLRIAVEDGVVEVAIDRPPVNALDEAAFAEIRRCFDQITLDPDLRAVVLCARGDRAFCAGTDVKDFANQHVGDTAWAMNHARLARDCFASIYRCTKPVIAAVGAPALGAGIGLVGCCDAVMASGKAAFGLPEIDVGVLGGAGFIARMVPRQQARIMQYTGLRLGAAEMERFGSVVAVPDGTTAEQAAHELARQIAGKSAAAIRLAKEGFNLLELGQLSLFEGYVYEQSLTERLSVHPDANAASSAFLRKR